MEIPADCICTTDCPEDPAENPCLSCRGLDIYEPCPVVGFGDGEDPLEWRDAYDS